MDQDYLRSGAYKDYSTPPPTTTTVICMHIFSMSYRVDRAYGLSGANRNTHRGCAQSLQMIVRTWRRPRSWSIRILRDSFVCFRSSFQDRPFISHELGWYQSFHTPHAWTIPAHLEASEKRLIIIRQRHRLE